MSMAQCYPAYAGEHKIRVVTIKTRLHVSWMYFIYNQFIFKIINFRCFVLNLAVSCGRGLDAPGNGSIVSIPEKEFLIYEDEIRFACDRGFRLVGNNVSVCTETGEWSSQTPTCESK